MTTTVYGIAVDSSGNAYVTGYHSIDRLPHGEPAPGSFSGGPPGTRSWPD